MAFGKKVAKDFDVIIGLNSSIDGDIVSEGSVRIDGKVTGSVKSSGDVIVGEQAVVNADIQAHFCEISGKVEGAVHSDTFLKIHSSGSLVGDITVSSFTIDEGGVFKGNCDINPEKKERNITEKKTEKNEAPKDSNKKQKHNNKNEESNNNTQKKAV